MSRFRRAGLFAVVFIWLTPALALAHPLGNFTINHYAGIRVEVGRVLVDLVIDQAEVPAFQERRAIDTNGDGAISDAEASEHREAACGDIAGSLHLEVEGAALPLRPTSAGLSFPMGTSGLATLRLTCLFEATLSSPLQTDRPTRVSFRDDTYLERIGWREIVVEASGATTTVVDGDALATSPSRRLTVYPEELAARPLEHRSVTVTAVAGGPALPPFGVPDTQPMEAAVTDPGGTPGPGESSPAAAIPGGIGDDVASVLGATELTPLALLLALATAAGLGAGHALTPGHGKTLMAAYLVGTRGTPLQAVALGVAVSASHTLGVLALAAIVAGAQDLLPPDLIVRVAPVVAGASIVVIGAWMLGRELRSRYRIRAAADPGDGHRDHQQHGHGHAHQHVHGHGHDHDHGGAIHPPDGVGSTTSWRGLVALGLTGGLVPSTSALLILLGSMAAGRAGYGLLLVIAFGAGMAAVMAGLGLALVVARDRLEGFPAASGLARVRGAAALVAAVAVFTIGIALTLQAAIAAPSV